MTNSNLIPIASRIFCGAPMPTVDSETFWTFLSISTPHKKWITRRIDEYQFEQGIDYTSEIRATTGRPKTKYYLSLDMAKELAMVERNDKGRQARRYFIECEKRLKSQNTQITLPNLTRQRILTTVENGEVIAQRFLADDELVMSRKRYISYFKEPDIHFSDVEQLSELSKVVNERLIRVCQR